MALPGAFGDIALSLQLNLFPQVALTGPTNGASFTAPATITLAATASDSDGSVSQVEFFTLNPQLSTLNLIASVQSSPYRYVPDQRWRRPLHVHGASGR